MNTTLLIFNFLFCSIVVTPFLFSLKNAQGYNSFQKTKPQKDLGESAEMKEAQLINDDVSSSSAQNLETEILWCLEQFKISLESGKLGERQGTRNKDLKVISALQN